MSDEEAAASSSTEPRRPTGSLQAGTSELHETAGAAATIDRDAAAVRARPAPRDLSLRIPEAVIYLAAVIGAVAIGLGISNYLGQHPYVYAYLIAYAAFRIADLLVREQSMLGTDTAHFARRVMNELPVLAAFAAAPPARAFSSDFTRALMRTVIIRWSPAVSIDSSVIRFTLQNSS